MPADTGSRDACDVFGARPPENEATPSFPYRRLSSYYFFYFAFVGACTPYFGLYLKSLGFSPWRIGVLLSQMQLMRLFGPYFWGALSDRIGRRISIVRTTGFLSLPIFSCLLFARSFESLLFLLALHSFFWVAALPLVETLTFEHLRERAADYGKVRLWGSVGFIAAVMSLGGLLDRFPASSALWACLLPLAGIFLSALTIPDSPARPVIDAALPVADILRRPRVVAFFAAVFAMTAAHGPLNVFYSIFLAAHGYGAVEIGALWTLGVLAEIAFFFFMPRLVRRYRLRAILLSSFSAAFIRFIMIGFGVESPVILIAAQLLHGLTFGAFHAASIASVGTLFPGKTRSRGQALYASASFGAGGLTGSLVSGWSWGSFGPSATFAAASAFAAFAFIAVGLGGLGESRDHGVA
ncbi:MAG: MFS transporter [Candidatus Accumulibacter sp.]|jgi:PPP family 3-phenylpropionic acid transporter|nr:MFS transporter [Accumulibacter sp.]